VAAASVASGIVAASLPAEAGDNVVLYERDFDSVLFPWRPLAERGVELRHLPLERLAEGIDDRTALVAVSLVQSSDGRIPDLAAIKATGVRLFLDGTQAVGAIAVDLDGVDYLVAHSYKWLVSPRGLAFLYVRPERLGEITPWLAGWKSRANPFEDFYGAPERAADALERLKSAGVSCSARSGSIRFAFHLYNDEEDVALALEALRPGAAVRSEA
jgi:selenocysteine lyase/cysteine desulfurase